MSKPVTVTIAHELGKAEARRRVEAGLGDLSRHLGSLGGVSRRWEGDRLSFAFSAMGQAISGGVEVEERTVRLEVLLPTLLAMMAGKLTGRLEQEGQLLLEKK
jgi:putative polyhydroxyalkanoate system protein